jgi:hypothetical protein
MHRFLALGLSAVLFLSAVGCANSPSSSPSPPPTLASPSAAASSATADDLALNHHPATGLAFRLPDSWTRKPEGENVLRVTDPDGGVSLVIFDRPNDEVEGTFARVDQEVERYLTHVKADPGTKRAGMLNGLSQVSEEGKATDPSGKPTRWSIWAVRGRSERSLVVLAWGRIDAPQVERIHDSIEAEPGLPRPEAEP